MIKEKYIIDFFKGCTGPFVLLLIIIFQRTSSPTCWVYFAIHGSYGLMWVIKSNIFGDKKWERDCTIKRGIMLTSGLLGYWVIPFLLITSKIEAHGIIIAVSVTSNILGTFFHFLSDLHKSLFIEYHKGHLLNNGLWKYTRNPNYFGELLIYFSFALLSMHILSFFILGSIVVIEWIPNMINKDKSLSRYPEFNEYKKNSGFLFPNISGVLGLNEYRANSVKKIK